MRRIKSTRWATTASQQPLALGCPILTGPGPQPNPNCQSVVEGYVLGPSGQPVRGATVVIEGTGWSDRMMTDDNGHYCFGGLCAGSATPSAYLPGGQVGQAAQVNLNGQDSLRQDLRAAPAQIAPSPGLALAQQTPTPEPDMPLTGYSGWLLVGAALLGTLLLLSAGARRLLDVRERTQDRDWVAAA